MMKKFSEYLQNCVEIPPVLIQILNHVGYNSFIALKGVNQNNIVEIEKYVSENLLDFKHILSNSVYARMEKFVFFLPGHKAIICNLPLFVEKYEHDTENERFVETLPISFMMKQMLKTAMRNDKRDQRHHQFSVEIQHFATYIYMICGKGCYEVLCNNLPLPQANTICE